MFTGATITLSVTYHYTPPPSITDITLTPYLNTTKPLPLTTQTTYPPVELIIQPLPTLTTTLTHNTSTICISLVQNNDLSIDLPLVPPPPFDPPKFPPSTLPNSTYLTLTHTHTPINQSYIHTTNSTQTKPYPQLIITHNTTKLHRRHNTLAHDTNITTHPHTTTNITHLPTRILTQNQTHETLATFKLSQNINTIPHSTISIPLIDTTNNTSSNHQIHNMISSSTTTVDNPITPTTKLIPFRTT